MTDKTNTRFVYTIEVIKWDINLQPKTFATRTESKHEYQRVSERLYETCKDEMKKGIIRDYRITTYEHDKNRKTTYAN